MRVRDLNDLFTGIFLIVVALAALELSKNLPVGTATSMGPAYVPRLMCFVQIAFGAGIVLQGFLIDGTTFEAWRLRPLLAILGSVAFFCFAIERLGLAAAVVGLVLMSTFAHRPTRWIEAVVLAVGMAVFAVVVFVGGLGLSMLVWPEALVR
jgi:putative tricarboxylic transport membrane protein